MSAVWRSNAFLYGAITLFLVAPLFIVDVIPLYDLPAHLARQYILFGPPSPYYAPQWRIVPNLALDIWVAVFHKFLSIDMSVRLFLATTIIQLFWGTIALHRVFFNNTETRLIVSAALFAYNGPFLFGFINLSFGFGMMLWTFAIWFQYREKLTIQLILACITSIMLISHLFAFAVYAVVLISFLIGDYITGFRSIKKILSYTLHLLAPISIYIILMPRAEMNGLIGYNPISSKIADIYSSLGLYNPFLDMLTLLFLLIAIIIGWRKIYVASFMWLPLASLAMVYLLLPHNLGQGSFVDYRMPTAFALFTCASINWRNLNEQYRVRVEAALFIVFVMRILFMIMQWQNWQIDFMEIQRAFSKLPSGSKLLTLSADPNTIDFSTPPPLGHVDAFAVINHGALVPDLFAGLAHEVIIYREPYNRIATQEPSVALEPEFDYVLLLRPENIPKDHMPHYSEISHGRTFSFGKIMH